ncbi:hypothetical protein B6A27_08150 [Anoxybacillus sp. UARK-01]|uniref:hypothetical protein n=1 Tax=Anoxybacillaceae TaxID=3120669 RepID=UPI0009B9D041|nr:hypothetical protein B6A27_08150 [Anoxybacillus sp. UARK-01]
MLIGLYNMDAPLVEKGSLRRLRLFFSHVLIRAAKKRSATISKTIIMRKSI